MNNKIISSRLEHAKSLLPADLQHPAVLNLLQCALAEDLSAQADLSILENNLLAGDITSSATVPEETCLMGYIRAKATGVVAGLPLAQAVFSLVDPDVYANLLGVDGDR